jgi:site-specific recombinase XerD
MGRMRRDPDAVNLQRPAARAKLKPRREPYWQQIYPGRHLGFRRLKVNGKEADTDAGTWIGKVMVEGQRRIRRLGDLSALPDYAAAEKAARAFFDHVDRGGAPERATVRQALERYAAGIRGGIAGRNKGSLSVEQREAKAREVERFIRYALGDLANVQLTALKQRALQHWREELHQGRTASSVNRMMTILRAGLNFALEQEMVTDASAWTRALKSIEGAGNRRERYVTLDERRALLEHMRPDFRPYATLLCLVPLRPGDPEEMLVKHYDARTRTLTVPAGKTAARRIPLSPEAETAIREACRDKLPGALMFMQRNGSRWFKEARREVVNEARQGAGLGDDVVLYAIRSSVITDMIVGGADPLTVARLSGTSLQMIQKHYGHLVDAHAREALSLVRL